MKRLLGIFLILASSCSLFEEEEEKVKVWIYINSSQLFLTPPPGGNSSGTYSGIYVEDIKSPSIIKSLSFKTSDGFVHTIPVNKIYNFYSSTGAGDTEPFEIPNRDYSKMTITTGDVIKKVRYNSNGTYTILEKGPITGDFNIFGVYQVNTMSNYDPFTSPSGKKYGADSYVQRLELVSTTNLVRTTVGTSVDNSFEYDLDIDATPLNPAKGSTALGGCLIGTWERSICGGTAKAVVRFDGSSGSFSDVDCTGQCTRSFSFTYKVLSTSQMEIKYTSGTICGQPSVPNGGTQSYSCSGTTLQFGNTYTKR